MIVLSEERTRYIGMHYLWYIDANDSHWQGNAYEHLRYRHRSNDPATFYDDTAQAVYAHLTGFYCSNWHGDQGLQGDDAFQSDSTMNAYLAWLASTDNPFRDFTLAVYAEFEGGPARTPTVQQILTEMEYHRSTKFGYPNYERRRAINKTATIQAGTPVYLANQPVMAVYSLQSPVRGDAWLQAVQQYEAAHPGETIYLDFDIWTDYSSWANYSLIDCWHKFSPAGDGVYVHKQAAEIGGHSVTVCPGHHNPPQAVLLARSLSGFTNALDVAMAWVNTLKPQGFGLNEVIVTTFKEFPEASHVCQAVANSGSVPILDAPDGLVAGEYLYAMRQRFPALTHPGALTGPTRVGLVGNGRSRPTLTTSGRTEAVLG